MYMKFGSSLTDTYEKYDNFINIRQHILYFENMKIPFHLPRKFYPSNKTWVLPSVPRTGHPYTGGLRPPRPPP